MIDCNVDFGVLDCGKIPDCEKVLGTRNIITKKLIFEGSKASGVTFDCNDDGQIYAGENGYNYKRGDIIEIRSRSNDDGSWDRPENVTIRNCVITGSVRIKGMGGNGEAVAVRDSSYRSGHVARVRRAAPVNTVLERVKIIGTGRTPLYLAPGVTRTKLLGSVITGKAEAAGIYLDAESAFNVLQGNRVEVDTEDKSVAGYYDYGWPQLAIDASSHNRIVNNNFSSLNEGGIYLYRNCGRGGTVRHSTPSRNIIVNNIFYYNRYKGYAPAVFLGSRDLDSWYEEKLSTSCEDDEKVSPRVGSAASNADHATHNVVMQNQFYRRKVWTFRGGYPALREATVKDMIRSRDWDDNSPNFIDHNELVTAETVDEERRAGCYVPAADPAFLPHGTRVELMQDRGRERACYSLFTCRDGDSSRSRVRDCRIRRVPHSCRIEDSNVGCHRELQCPARHEILGARVACNLESGRIAETQVSRVLFNRMEVVRASDRESQGECYVGFDKLSQGRRELQFIRLFPNNLPYGCREHDSNGGDCHIRVVLYCQRSGTDGGPTIEFDDLPNTKSGRSSTDATPPG